MKTYIAPRLTAIADFKRVTNGIGASYSRDWWGAWTIWYNN